MAIRNILVEGDPALHKVCRPVTEFNERLWQLLDDMAETLHESGGVGLAGPQVGVLRRLFIMDMGDGAGVIECINPKIIARKGQHEVEEGCLSCPGEWGIVVRPKEAIMQAQNRKGEAFTLKGEGMLAQCMCHENDHLDGILFKQKVVRMLTPDDMQSRRKKR